jgi:hypothetical protein
VKATLSPGVGYASSGQELVRGKYPLYPELSSQQRVNS